MTASNVAVPQAGIAAVNGKGLSISRDSTVLSAAGIIGLLSEPQVEVWVYAVNMLLDIVDFFWYEISEAAPRIEALALELAQPGPAWLLLSKLNFHLGNYEKSVGFALKAGQLFDFSENSPFVQTILAKAVDQYVELRVHNDDHPHDTRIIEPELEELVERMVLNCISSGEFRHAIGIAIESRRLDTLKLVLQSSRPLQEHLLYAQQAILKNTMKLDYQHKVLAVLSNLGVQAEDADFVFVADCLVAMGDVKGAIELISRLVQESLLPQSINQRQQLSPTLYQILFNTSAAATKEFSSKVLSAIKELASQSANEDTAVHFANLISIADGSRSTQLQLEFLYRNNNADMLIMERTKESMNAHNSMHHSVLSCANAIMHAGTTNDEFLRKNLEWLSYATNWAKFTAASSLGVVHRGQAAKGREILKPYLPSNDGSGSPFSEGGALYALGLINAFNGTAERSYFIDQMNQTDSDELLHGLCLGLGASAMSSHDLELVDLIKGVLYRDNAVSGEAAAIAIGLIMHSSGNYEVVNELLLYAHETQHEKSIRGISVGVSLIFTGLYDKADMAIDQMLADKDPIIRYGGTWTLATAYAGSSKSKALERLLHSAVSDANDDVRRTATTALGFVLCRNPAELPRIVELLTESYNPHVRYGAALALGVAFAGSGSKIAIELIKPMCKDFTDFVRQGAYVSLAMIMMQHNSTTCESVSWARSTFESVVSTKHEDATAKFGAILAQGIIDAGGRNSVISLMSTSGHVNRIAVAGAVLFCQFWYWYPLVHFVCLALTPTALIAVDTQLCIPKFEIDCMARPSRFALPPPVKPAVLELVTATLSTTAKAAARAKKSGKGSEMEIDTESTPKTSAAPSPQISTSMDVDHKNLAHPETSPESEAKTGAVEAAVEPESFKISNMSRVTLGQFPLVAFPKDSKFVPLMRLWQGEIVVVADQRPEQSVEYLQLSEIKTGESGGTAEEPEPPAPFECPEI